MVDSRACAVPSCMAREFQDWLAGTLEVSEDKEVAWCWRELIGGAGLEFLVQNVQQALVLAIR